MLFSLKKEKEKINLDCFFFKKNGSIILTSPKLEATVLPPRWQRRSHSSPSGRGCRARSHFTDGQTEGSPLVYGSETPQRATHRRTDTPHVPAGKTSRGLGHTRRASCTSSANQSHKLCKRLLAFKKHVSKRKD